MEIGDYHGATIQNKMARVMHAYLICGHVGEEHLILSAILAADLLAIHPSCVPPSCEEMCGTAPKAETKRRKERHRRGRHQKAQHSVLPRIEQSHTCLLFDLEHDERVVLQHGRDPLTAQVAPLGKPLLVVVRENGCRHKERAEVQVTRSPRKTWVPASRSMVFVTRGTRNTPCTDMRHELFGFQRHT